MSPNQPGVLVLNSCDITPPQANFNTGRMSPTALHILRESADRQLDDPTTPLSDWQYLTPRLGTAKLS